MDEKDAFRERETDYSVGNTGRRKRAFERRRLVIRTANHFDRFRVHLEYESTTAFGTPRGRVAKTASFPTTLEHASGV